MTITLTILFLLALLCITGQTHNRKKHYNSMWLCKDGKKYNR